MQNYNQAVLANSISMSYDKTGEGLHPLILIHGFPFNKGMWQPQTEALNTTFHIFSYDIRGFGASTSEELRPASINLFAEDLIAFMDATHIEKAVVCGFSMGGYILLNAISRFPERFSAIILSDTQSIADSIEAKENRENSILEINHFGIEPFTKKFIKKVFTEASLKYKKELVKTVQKSIMTTAPEAIIATLKALANRADTSETLHKIEVPTLIICGADDTLTPVAQAQFLQNSIPNAQLKIIKKAGHMANMEQPNHYNKIIFDFISNLPHLSTIKLYGDENLVMEPKTHTNLISNLNKENREKNSNMIL